MSFHAALVSHYARVRERLGAPPIGILAIEPPKPFMLLDFRPEPHMAADPIPDQRDRSGPEVDLLGADAELIGARRALTIFARMRTEDPTAHSVRQIQVATAVAFRVRLAEMLGRSHTHGISRIRQIAMTLADAACSCSRQEVARRFDRDHATVWYAAKKFAALLDGAASTIEARHVG